MPGRVSSRCAVTIDSLCYRPGRGFAIQDVSFAVPVGAVFGFLGANGSGKTTTIRLMLGLLPASRGSIDLLGYPIPRGSARALAHVGYVPESPHLYQSLTVEMAIHYHAGFYSSWDDALASSLMQRLRLPRARRLRVLSKGELRKMMILLALSQRPRLLVLDEPTDGLDPVVRREILDVLQTSVDDTGTTVFMSSHLVHELETVCDHIAVMDDGRILAAERLSHFRSQFARLIVSGPPEKVPDFPCTLLRAEQEAEQGGRWCWFVRGWDESGTAALQASDVTLHGVDGLDLEAGFVELLRSVRDDAHE